MSSIIAEYAYEIVSSVLCLAIKLKINRWSLVTASKRQYPLILKLSNISNKIDKLHTLQKMLCAICHELK